MLVFCRNRFDIFIIDNEDDNDIAVVHSSAFSEQLEDIVHKSRGSFDDETVFVQANGTPKKKVCILLMVAVAKLIIIMLYLTGQ